MKNRVLKASVAGAMGGLALVSAPAFAHVGYGTALYDAPGIINPLTGAAGTGAFAGPGASGLTPTVTSNAGFLAGLDPYTLGNTHDIRFRYFTLDASFQVSFTITGLPNATVTGNANPALNGITPDTLNPAFSLYNGVVPASSHDGVGDIANVAADPDVAAYLSTANDFAPWSPFAGVNGVRGGLNAGAPGNAPGLWGVFDSNGNITTGNNGAWTATSTAATDTHGPNYLGNLDTPKVATITYTGISGADAPFGAAITDSHGGIQSVIGADGNVDNQVSWSGILNAGVYTLAIGGANLSDYAALFNDVRASLAGSSTDLGANNAYAADRLPRNASITFSVTPVPVPAAVWLFGGVLGAMGMFGRRKHASA